jgi:hypothetical protein
MRRWAAVSSVVGALTLACSAQAAVRPFGVRTSQGASMIRVWIAPRAADARWQAFLNGRDVSAALGYVAPGGRWIVISRSNGVRFGRNRFVVRVRYPSGQRRIVRVFTVSRERPLAAAGSDRHLPGPGRVQLSAVGSMPAHGGSLRYRWLIVRKPAGSRARLLGATSRRARLITDRPGTYMLHLVLRERTRRARAALSAPSVDLVQVQQSASGTKQGIFVVAEGLTSSAGKLRVSGARSPARMRSAPARAGPTSRSSSIARRWSRCRADTPRRTTSRATAPAQRCCRRRLPPLPRGSAAS